MLSANEFHEQVNQVKKPTKAQHKHSEKISEMVAWLDLLHPLDGWNLESDGKLKVYKKNVDGFQYAFVRGNIKSTRSVLELISIVTSIEHRNEWDLRSDSLSIIDHLDSDSCLVHAIQKGQFPVAPRDLGLVTLLRETENGMDFIATSIEDSKIPSTKWSQVRAWTFAGWRFIETEDGVDVSYIVYVDPCGNVPSAIFKLVQSQLAQCVALADDCVENFVVLKHSGITSTKVGKERLDCQVKKGPMVIGVPARLQVQVQTPPGTQMEWQDKGKMKLLTLNIPTDGRLLIQ